MMLGPEMYAASLKAASFENLITERNELIEKIKQLEPIAYASEKTDPLWDINPGPDVQYQVKLECLSALCAVLKEKYNDEIVWGERRKGKSTEPNAVVDSIQLIHGSCANQEVDVVVNAANSGLWAGGGICGVIFEKAGMAELTSACKKYKTPLRDGSAVITPAFNITNAKAIIHAVGPNFRNTPNAIKELYEAYYNSLKVMMENGYHTISFPLISSGIFAGNLKNAVAESTKQCCRAYSEFIEDYPDYEVEVLLCAFTDKEMTEAEAEFNRFYGE